MYKYVLFIDQMKPAVFQENEKVKMISFEILEDNAIFACPY